jgi:anaerobic magnesium-protoporphyrin IX monomethyl ester cyclase
MDILLTHGYYLFADPHELQVMKPYPPLGILYISSHLKAKGFQVELFDSTFSTLQAFEQHIAQRRPPVVGLYANMLTRANVLKMVQICKAHGSTVIAGGPDPANYPEHYLEWGVDIVVIGEGEVTLETLLPHLARHGLRNLEQIQGIAYQEEARQVYQTPSRPYIEDLSAQPFPDRAAIDLERYMAVWRTHHGQSAVSLITARGCPYRCNWCSHAVYGYSHRRRSPENVADEVEEILERYQPDLLWYADDVFTINFRWFEAYAAELKRRNIRIPFETISREDRLNEAIVRTLAEMGAYRIWVGAESGSQRILDAMERRTNAARVSKVVHLLQQQDIQAGMFIMLGYDGEEQDDLEETVALLKEANPEIFLTTLAYPIKGTPYYEKVAGQVVALRPWQQGSDRDHTVLGRRSRRFYQFATRWITGEVGYHRQRQSPQPNYLRMAKAFANLQIGRLGMWVTRGELEEGIESGQRRGQWTAV